MTDPRRGLRWRVAWLVVAAAMVGMWRLAAGPGGGHVVQVEFGMVPDLEGAMVLIDGEEAGTLERRGPRTLTGFRVAEGDHMVQVGLEGCPGEPARITAGFGTGLVRLVAEQEDRATARGIGCRVVLRR